MHVLVVEDDPVWRRVISHTLAKHGAVVVDVNSLERAVEELTTATYDLVLLDYELPDGNGLDLLDRCDRTLFGCVVLVTGYADLHDLNDERSSLVEGYLTKPFLSTDLAALLELQRPALVTALVANHQ
jgi:CheY-like chemotaxis protein